MKYKPILSRHPPTKKLFSLDLQPAQAWIAILSFILFSGLCILVGAGKILNLAFPAAAFAVGVLLYVRYPILYIGFVWWMWFLTPLIRRLADYRSSFTEPSPILLAPYLVVLASLPTLWQNLPKIHRQGGLPFVLSFVGVFYGYLVGLIHGSPVSVTKALLDWLVPLLFSFYLFVRWQDYPKYQANIQRIFAWGVLVQGSYGIFQFLAAPEWDRFWLINVGMSSAGKPEPLGIRVWSTMNGPGVFAVFMMAGLLILFKNSTAIRTPASIAGYLAFLLSSVRSAWLGWVVGLFTLGTSLKASLQIRLLITILVMGICIIPVTTLEPFSQVINSRIESISNVEDDGSASARKYLFEQNIEAAITKFDGNGIGNADAYSDNAILTILFSLGWLGTFFYFSGIILLLFKLFQNSQVSFDPFLGTARAITLGVFVQLAFGSVMLGGPGIVLWGFLGIGIAGCRYQQYQQSSNPKLHS